MKSIDKVLENKMEIFIQGIFLVVGFVMLIKGADWFVYGASNIADRFGIPQIVIGLTIVAMGTSVRRRIEIGFNSELNSRRLPIRLRGIICDCTHISEQPHIIVALFGSRNYPVLKQV